MQPDMNTAWTYDLKQVGPDILRIFSLMFHDPVSDELQSLLKKCNLTNKKWKCGPHVHSVLKYMSGTLKCDELKTIGLLRSLVLDQYGKIMAYSPPKCIIPSTDELDDRFSDDNIIVDEFVEGTMINVFYHRPNGQDEGADWEVSTKSCVGANIVFHSLGPDATETTTTTTTETTTTTTTTSATDQKKTFRRMFLECMDAARLDFNALQKDCSYSFVMQHPNNHIVRRVTEPALYLIAVYKIDNEALVIEEQCRNEHLAKINGSNATFVRLPLQFTDVGLRQLQDIYTSLNAPYDFPGWYAASAAPECVSSIATRTTNGLKTCTAVNPSCSSSTCHCVNRAR
jgi:hypothetical protein